MNKIKHSFCLFLSAFIFQVFYVHDVVANMSDKEFAKHTGSKVNEAFCVGALIDESSIPFSKKISSLQLKMNVENYLNDALKKVSKNRGISSNKNKYRKIEIKLNGTDCWLSGKYRLTGDLNDHLGGTNEIFHSIKIKINDGKIDNILKFKLFTPKSRGGRLEVLNSVIHQKLNLLAPRTALTNVQIGGQSYNAIFQEDISEQLLEHNNLHPSILLEGDERYLPFNLPKIINKKIIANEQFKHISLYTSKTLGQSYQHTSIFNEQKRDSPIFLDFFPVDSQNELIYFHLLNFSLNNMHGLSLDDSRFVFDHISRRFRPIYYDGHTNVIISNTSKINFNIPDDIRLKLLKDLKSLDLIQLMSELGDLGAQFSVKELQQIISKSISFINSAKMQKSLHAPEEKFKNLTGFGFIQKTATDVIRRNDLSSLQVSWMLGSNLLKKCIYTKDSGNCVQKTLSEHQKLAAQIETQSLKNGIFLHGLSEEENDATYFQELSFNTLTLLGTGTTIEHSRNLELLVNNVSKSVIVKSRYNNTSESQIKISNGVLDGWEFVIEKGVFLGYEKYTDTRASRFGLTGCITFNDIIIKSLKLHMHETMCEDAIHFVRTKGNIEDITIKKAFADGIDADFSDLVFNNLVVSNAGNDCVDFSAGTYQIKESKFNKCGDKGLSVGENAKVLIGNNEIRDALIGIVAKDSSTVVVMETALFNVDICLAAYKKKQEYGAATLNVKKILCSSDKYFNQNGSHLSY